MICSTSQSGNQENFPMHTAYVKTASHGGELLLPVLFELSYAPPPGLQQAFTQCPVLQEFLRVLMSVYCLCCLCKFLSGVVCLCPSLFFKKRRLAFYCHHPHLFDLQQTRSEMIQRFGHNNTIATMLFEQRYCLDKHPTAACSQEKSGAVFIITVYLTASARAVPEARSHSPTSSSQTLKPGSKPSVWSH